METDSSISGCISVADVVVNLNGRDKGRLFFVTSVDGGDVCLADGRHRRLERPKRKKAKHVKPVAKSGSRAALALQSGDKVTNAELWRALAEVRGNLSAQAEEVLKADGADGRGLYEASAAQVREAVKTIGTGGGGN